MNFSIVYGKSLKEAWINLLTMHVKRLGEAKVNLFAMHA